MRERKRIRTAHSRAARRRLRRIRKLGKARHARCRTDAGVGKSQILAAAALAVVVGGTDEKALAQGLTNVVSLPAVVGQEYYAGGREEVRFAQSFRTGDSVTGYSIESVTLNIRCNPCSTDVTLSIHRDSRSGGQNVPGARLATLTGSTDGLTSGLNLFRVPSGVMFAPQTYYHVVLNLSSREVIFVGARGTSGQSNNAGSFATLSRGWRLDRVMQVYEPEPAGTNFGWQDQRRWMSLSIWGRARLRVPSWDPNRVDTAATGAPSISGEPTVGKTLFADGGNISDENGLNDIHYVWYRATDRAGTGREMIKGAAEDPFGTDVVSGMTPADDGHIYTLTAADQGKVIGVRASFFDNCNCAPDLRNPLPNWTSTGTPEVLPIYWYPRSGAIRRINDPATGKPTVRGSFAVGETLTASRGTVGDPNGAPATESAYSYQWQNFRNDRWLEIAGANSSTYTLEVSDLDKDVRVETIFTDLAGHRERDLYSAGQTVKAAATIRPSGAATISEGEANAMLSFDVELTHVHIREATVEWRVDFDSSDTDEADFAAGEGSTGGTVTFAARTRGPKTISVAIADDLVDEPDLESFTVALIGTDTVLPSSMPSLAKATGAIADDDGAPTVSIEFEPPEVTEVAEGENLTLAVNLSHASSSELRVAYTMGEGASTAVASDYRDLTVNGSAEGSPLIFAAGERSKTITLQAVADNLDEESETIVIALSNQLNPALVTLAEEGSAEVTILDGDDAPMASIAPATLEADEGGDLAFTVSLNRPSSREIQIAYTLGGEDSTATVGIDYTDETENEGAMGSPLIFEPGNTSKSILLRSVDDEADEVHETVVVALSEPPESVPATLAPSMSMATGTILDNDLPVVTVANTPASVDEGATAKFVLSREGVVTGTLTATFTIDESGDILPLDAELPDSIQFEENAATVTVSVLTFDDAIDEANGGLTLTLAEGDANFRRGEASMHTIAVMDNDLPFVTATPKSETVVEGSPVIFVFTRQEADLSSPRQVEFTVSAPPNILQNEAINSNSVEIPENDSMVEVELATVDDELYRADNIVELTLSDGKPNYAVPETPDNVVTVTVSDNEDPPKVSVSASTPLRVDEGASIEITFELNEISGRDAEIPYTLVPGNGATDGDYSTQPASPLTIGAGGRSTTLTLTATADIEDESGETVAVGLGTLTHADPADNAAERSVTIAMRDANKPATGSLTIGGTATVGQTLSADTSGIFDNVNGLFFVRFDYQWQSEVAAGVWQDISSATTADYILTPADIGARYRVTVMFSDDDGYPESLTSEATTAVERRPDLDAMGTVSIAGTLTVGQEIEATVEDDVSDANGLTGPSYEYQWEHETDGGSWLAITGATRMAYTLVPADALKRMRVVVTFSDDEGYDESLTSDATTAVERRPDSDAMGTVSITGTLTVGQVIEASVEVDVSDANGLTDPSYEYQWQREVSASTWDDISGEMDSTYTLFPADALKRMRVVVTFMDDEGYDESLTSDATTAVERRPDSDAMGTVSITGTLTVGQVIEASVEDDVSDANGLTDPSYEYQWQREVSDSTWNDISGEMDSTYTLVPADALKRVRVSVAFMDDEGYDESLTSDATAAVARRDDSDAIGTVSITGTLTVGQEIEATVEDDVSDANGLTNPSYEYQWEREATGGSWLTVTSATSMAYTLVPADALKRMRVVVTFMDDEGYDESLTSDATTAVERRPDSDAMGTVSITGTLTVGQEIEATVEDDVSDANGLTGPSYEYQWEHETDGGSWLTITNATSMAYTLVPADALKRMRVVVTFSDDEGYDESLTSDATDAVARRPDSDATGTVLISGTVRVGEEIEATVEDGVSDANGLTGPTYRYQWQREESAGMWNDISGGMDSTYSLVPADALKRVRVLVTFMDDEGYDESLTSDATAAVARRDDSDATGTVLISGTVRVGEEIEATVEDDVSDANGLTNPMYEYQWQREVPASTWNDISGEMDSTYMLVPADALKRVRVVVSFSDDEGYDESLTSDATVAVARRPDSNATGTVLISGTVRVGEEIEATVEDGVSDANGLTDLTYQYRWQREVSAGMWNDISSEMDSTYTLVPADALKRVRVLVAFMDDEGYDESLTSDATDAVARRPDSDATGTVLISGTVRVGEEIEATVEDDVSDANGLTNPTYKYQWQREVPAGMWDDISGEMDSTYTLVPADALKRIRVLVTFMDDEGYDESLTSDATDAVARRPDSDATGTVLIAGTLTVGQEIEATVEDGVSDANGLTDPTYQYQWQREVSAGMWNDISGGTDSTYTLVPADALKRVRVVVSFSDDEGYDESLTSDATTAVERRPDSDASGTVLIAGTLTVGQEIEATVEDGVSDANGLTDPTYQYQWQREVSDGMWNDIFGGMDSMYTLVPADARRRVRVVVSFSDDEGYDESLTSDATAAVARRDDSDATGTVSISGEIRVGEEIEAMVGDDVSDANGLTDPEYIYHWQREVVADSWQNVSITTSTKYRLVPADALKRIRVVVSFMDDEGYQESLRSEPTNPVSRRNDFEATGEVTVTGSTTVGQELTATVSNADDANGLTSPTYTYHWEREVTGGSWQAATSDSVMMYTLVPADAGLRVRVRVTFHDDEGFDESLTSDATAAVARRDDSDATGTVSITGTTTVGEEIEATVGDDVLDANGLTNPTYQFQWQREVSAGMWSDISGEMDATYMLVPADALKRVRVEVRFSDDEGYDELLTSVATAAVARRDDSDAMGTVSISGTLRVGEEVEAMVRSDVSDANGLTDPTYQYQWQREVSAGIWNDISSEVDSMYLLVPEDALRRVRVEVRFSDDEGYDETLTSDATAVVARRDDSDAMGTVSITGILTVGEEVTATVSNAADANGLTSPTYTYNWEREVTGGSWQAATSDSVMMYTLVPADAGMRVRVRVTFLDDEGYDESLTSDATSTVSNRPDSDASGLVSITGTTTVGEELSATVSNAADANGLTSPTYSYQWQREDAEGSWQAINAGNAKEYTLVPADAGLRVRVRVSFHDDEGYDESLTSDATAAVARRDDSDATGTVTVTGTARVGEELAATVSDDLTDANGLTSPSFGYQWWRVDVEETQDAVAIGEDSSAYQINKVDQGQKIFVVVSFEDDEGYDESLTSEPTAAIVRRRDSVATGKVTITGSARVGMALEADTSSIVDTVNGLTAPGYGYQWERWDGNSNSVPEEISGADSNTYIPVKADEGMQLRVAVSFNDDDEYPESKTSEFTTPVEVRTNTPATGTVTVGGPARVGSSLTANTAGITDLVNGLTVPVFSYQWQRGDSASDADPEDIATAKSSTYLLVDSDEDSYFRVVVRFTDDDGHMETKTSQYAGPVEARPTVPDDGPPMVTVMAVSDAVDEGSPVRFSLIRSGASIGPLSVSFVVSSSKQNLIVAPPTSAIIEDGFQTTLLEINTLDDSVDGIDSTVTLTLEPSSSNYRLGEAGQRTATVTVRDNDTPEISIIAPDTVAEGDSFVFMVRLSGASSRSISVDYAVTGGAAAGEATAGEDFEAVSGTLTFEPGNISGMITVETMLDDFDEPDEAVLVTLSDPQPAGAASMGSVPLVATTMIDDGVPAFSMRRLPAIRSEAGGQTIDFVVNLDPPSMLEISVQFELSGDAQLGTDFTCAIFEYDDDDAVGPDTFSSCPTRPSAGNSEPGRLIYKPRQRGKAIRITSLPGADGGKPGEIVVTLGAITPAGSATIVGDVSITAQIGASSLVEFVREGATSMLHYHIDRFQAVTSNIALSRLDGRGVDNFQAQGVDGIDKFAADMRIDEGITRSKWASWGSLTYSTVGGTGEGSVYDLYTGVDMRTDSGNGAMGLLVGYEAGNIEVGEADYSSSHLQLGIYGAVRLGRGVILDGAAAVGVGEPSVELGSVSAELESQRVTVRADLSGDKGWGSDRLALVPKVGLLYSTDSLDGFTDDAGGFAAENTFSFSRLSAGFRLIRRYSRGEYELQPQVNYDNEDLGDSDGSEDLADSNDGEDSEDADSSKISSSVQAAVRHRLTTGTYVGISGSVNGIGNSSIYQSYTLGLTAVMRF